MTELRNLPAEEPAEGISRTLAEWRSAHCRDVDYALTIELLAPFDRVTGTLGAGRRPGADTRGPGAGLAWREPRARVARSADQRDSARPHST